MSEQHPQPSDLLEALIDLGGPRIHTRRIALDTETSGLFVDSGARAATVSVAWHDSYGHWKDYFDLGDEEVRQWGGGIVTYRAENCGTIDKPNMINVISFAWPFDQGVAGTGKPEDDGQGALWAEADNQPQVEWDCLLGFLEEACENHGVKLVFHHAKFDQHIMRAGTRNLQGGIDLERYCGWDTQNVANLLWAYTGTTGLKPTSSRLWGDAETEEAQKIKDYLAAKKLSPGRWDLMPWDIIGTYADDDARKTIRLYEHQRELLTREATFGTGLFDGWLDGQQGRLNARDAVARRMQTSQMLYRMEKRGLPFDVAGAAHASRELKKRVKKLKTELPFKPATLPMAKHYWFGEGNVKGVEGLGLTPEAVTDKGAPQLNANIVRKLVERGVHGADVWRNVQKVSTADSRWYEGYAMLAGEDHRLRGSVRQNGTRSGRFSIERVQLQAIPHDYKLSGFQGLDGIPTPRQLIGAGVPEGWQLWELDLANAEARVAAMMAGCKKMLQMIHQGMDLHGETAIELFQKYPEDHDWGKYRSVAKRANFSLIFGVGWEKLQDDIEEQTGVILGEGETRKLVRDWNNLYPEYQRAIKKTASVVEARQRQYGRGWVQTANGERRWFVPGEESHKAFNQRVQANLAQFGIDWWLFGDEYIESHLTEEELQTGGLVMLIHDSMVLLLPDGVAETVVSGVQKVGTDLWAERFPGLPGGVDAKPWGGSD